MHTLLEYIKKDRLADALVEKLCLRFDACDNDDLRQPRNLAFCLAQVPSGHPLAEWYLWRVCGRGVPSPSVLLPYPVC